MRRKPVLPNAEPRLVKQPVQIGPVSYEPGVVLFASAYLVHHDPLVYPDPFAFRPERFLEQPPGTYTWIPFGGGRRRCIGASFAQLEMRRVLHVVLRRVRMRAASTTPERPVRRAIVYPPRRGVRVIVEPYGSAASRGNSPGMAPPAPLGPWGVHDGAAIGPEVLPPKVNRTSSGNEDGSASTGSPAPQRRGS